MIRFDGYYLTEAQAYEDSIANHYTKGYFHNAYVFLNNGKYLSAVKKVESSQVDFIPSDFNPDFLNNYRIRNGMLELTFHTNEEWEFTETFNGISALIWKNEDRTIEFVPWKKD